MQLDPHDPYGVPSGYVPRVTKSSLHRVDDDNKTNFQRVSDWLQACGKSRTGVDLSVQIGCHIEEFTEFLKCLEARGAVVTHYMSVSIDLLETVATELKKGTGEVKIDDDLREDCLDALCDLDVTGNGVAYFAGFDKDGADKAVLAANDAKLVNGKPVLKPGGKIGKPEGWQPPDLSRFV